eukprot:5730224-Pyramimonas_sp.AAC.1
MGLELDPRDLALAHMLGRVQGALEYRHYPFMLQRGHLALTCRSTHPHCPRSDTTKIQLLEGR